MRIEGTREGTKARKARMDNDVNMILMYFDDETVVACIKVYAVCNFTKRSPNSTVQSNFSQTERLTNKKE